MRKLVIIVPPFKLGVLVSLRLHNRSVLHTSSPSTIFLGSEPSSTGPNCQWLLQLVTVPSYSVTSFLLLSRLFPLSLCSLIHSAHVSLCSAHFSLFIDEVRLLDIFSFYLSLFTFTAARALSLTSCL